MNIKKNSDLIFFNLHKRENISIAVVIAIFVFDFVTKYFLVFDVDGFKRYSTLPKIFIEIGSVIFIFKNGIKDKRIVILVLILVLVSLLNTILSLGELSLNDLSNKLYNLNKYLFLFLFATAFLSFNVERRTKLLTQIRNTVIAIGIVNGLFMIFGLFSQFEILKAYPNTPRFGYNGFFLKTSEASYFYILLIITTYYDYLYNKANGLLCLYFILVSFLIGTKAIWLFVVLLILIHFLYHKKKQLRYIFGIMLIIGTGVVYFFKDIFIKLVVNSFSFGPEIYNKHSFITLITSTRDLLFINTLSHLKENATYTIYLFGGINLKKHGVEFEFVDLFLFFGIVGLVVYILLIKKLFFPEPYSKHKLLLFLALICVAFFAGNFFMSIICSIFAYVIFKYMDYLNKVN